MITSTILYNGNLRTTATHLASGEIIITDAPIDNQGKGEAFSPTDLVATALASCMITIIGIAAKSHNFSIDGTTAEVTKVMESYPRRISEIIITLNFPKEKNYSQKEKKIIEVSAYTCPVFHSLHQDLKKKISFNY